MGAIVLVGEGGVSENAGKLKNTILEWIESAHFEINPYEVGHE